MSRRSTHQAPEWTATQSWWLIASLVALGASLGFALLRMVGLA